MDIKQKFKKLSFVGGIFHVVLIFAGLLVIIFGLMGAAMGVGLSGSNSGWLLVVVPLIIGLGLIFGAIGFGKKSNLQSRHTRYVIYAFFIILILFLSYVSFVKPFLQRIGIFPSKLEFKFNPELNLQINSGADKNSRVEKFVSFTPKN